MLTKNSDSIDNRNSKVCSLIFGITIPTKAFNNNASNYGDNNSKNEKDDGDIDKADEELLVCLVVLTKNSDSIDNRNSKVCSLIFGITIPTKAINNNASNYGDNNSKNEKDDGDIDKADEELLVCLVVLTKNSDSIDNRNSKVCSLIFGITIPTKAFNNNASNYGDNNSKNEKDDGDIDKADEELLVCLIVLREKQ